MRVESTFGRLLTAGRWCALNLVGFGLIALAGALIYVVPAAAQSNTKDTQATQEEEALEELLTDEEEIKFKRDPPPPGSVGSNRWDDPSGSEEAPAAPVDPEQIITSPGNVDPAHDPLSKEEKHAAQIYVDDEIDKRLARVAGRVPDDEIDHHVVYTPSPAAQKDPNRKALERQLWKQRLAEYKQAKLADQLLKDLEGAGAEPAGGTAPDGAENDPSASRGGTAPKSGQSGNSEIGSLLERLLGTGGAGGEGKPGPTGQSASGAGRDNGADGAAGAAGNKDGSTEDRSSSGQGEGSAPTGSGEQPLGTVTLGEPPSAKSGRSTAFDKFVADSGLSGQQGAASGSAPNDEGGAAVQGSGASSTGAQSPDPGDVNVRAGIGQFSAVPRPKPRPAQPGTASATASAGSTGEGSGSRSDTAAAATPGPPASAGTTAVPPGTQNAQAPRNSPVGSTSASGSDGQDGSGTPNPLGDLLAAATAALSRAGPPETSTRDRTQLPKTTGQSSTPARELAQQATDPPQTSATNPTDDGERMPADGTPDTPAEQSGASGESFADRFSFSREIAALSSASSSAPSSAPETAAAEREHDAGSQSDAVTSGKDQVASLSSAEIAPPPLPTQAVLDPLADLGQASLAPANGDAATQAGGEAEKEKLQRQDFERVAMEKFIAKEALTPTEQIYIEGARETSLAKSEGQVNDQLRRAVVLQSTAAGIRKDVAAVVEAGETNNKLSYLEPAASAVNSDSRAVQAGDQAIEVATNRASGRSTPSFPTRESEVAELRPETGPPLGQENPHASAQQDAGETIKLFRPEKLKSAKPAKGTEETANPPADPVAARSERDRQLMQSERLAKKLEREARLETSKARFDNCVLFIFCSLTKLLPAQTSPEEPGLGAPAGSDEGVRLVRP